MTEESKSPTIWASIGTTINVGNFENYKLDMGLAGIPVDATEEEVQARIVKAKASITQVIFGLADELSKRADDVRIAYGLSKEK